jgi:hypothetical protein
MMDWPGFGGLILTHAQARLNRRQQSSPVDTPMQIDADAEVSLFVRDRVTG